MNDAGEQQLLRRAQTGDTAAFGDLVRHHQTAVLNVAYRLLGNLGDAEDAAQEAFLRAFRAIDRFDPKRPFAPWIKRITVNVCLNWLQAAQQRTQTAVTDLQHPAAEQAVTMDRWAHTAPTPERQLEVQEQNERLRQAILALPPIYRAVIELRHFQEMSYDEIAAALERPVSSVKSDLFRARKQLAERMRA